MGSERCGFIGNMGIVFKSIGLLSTVARARYLGSLVARLAG